MKWAILQSRFGIKRAFSKNNHYIIEFNAERVYEALHEVSREAFQSILLHELGHTLTYYHNSFLQNLNLIFVITNNRRNQAFEKITDIIAISRSLDRGFEIFNGLIEYRNWHQEHLSSTELKNYLVTYYQEDELINLKSYLSSASSPELKPTIEKLILNLNQIANLPLGFLEKL
ncbi:MAG: hypothetical protein H6621_07025 [Halobacteriovoraceae bacterium]|nr:hypothetical protein [Halobacteriovoraceae bacterium]